MTDTILPDIFIGRYFPDMSIIFSKIISNFITSRIFQLLINASLFKNTYQIIGPWIPASLFQKQTNLAVHEFHDVSKF